MKKKKTVVIIIFAVFLSVVIAYTVSAAVTLASEYDGDGGYSAFSGVVSHLFTDPFSVTFKKTAYKLFGVVMEKSVSAGYDGYLFPTVTDGFDYAKDIAGEMRYDGETKAGLLLSLQTRQKALSLDGCEFYVFVIPNSQTALRDKLRTPKKDGITAAEELQTYLHENGFDNFYMLSDSLKYKEYDTYNNTENAINGYGAYMAYREIAMRLAKENVDILTLDDADISVTYSDGASLAVDAGIEKLIKNKNVSYTANKFTCRYTSELFGSLTVCRLKDEYGVTDDTSLLLQIPSAERALFMPLFSASYANTLYSDSLSYSYSAVSAASPSVCVCILREDDVLSIINDADRKTYEARIENEGKTGVTSAPEIIAVSYKQSGSAFVAGVCEDGVSVTVVSAAGSASALCRDGLFIIELSAQKGEELTVYAKADEKEKSDTVKCTVPAAPSAEESVFAGSYSMLYYGETVKSYTGSDLYKPDELEGLKTRFEAILQRVREASGKDTKIIFLSAPNPLSVYPDAASDAHKNERSEKNRFDQFGEVLNSIDGVTFLDVRADMRQNSDKGKLYYQTDTHWTELGAYFGYSAIAKAAGQDPLSLESFELEYKTAPSGDLASFAGLSGLSEKVGFLTPLSSLKAVGIENKPKTIDRSVYAGALVSETADESLPKAVMIRDSYSGNLFPLICEHFSYLYCQRMWDYEPDYEKIAEASPDYVIYVISERNLDFWK